MDACAFSESAIVGLALLDDVPVVRVVEGPAVVVDVEDLPRRPVLGEGDAEVGIDPGGVAGVADLLFRVVAHDFSGQLQLVVIRELK